MKPKAEVLPTYSWFMKNEYKCELSWLIRVYSSNVMYCLIVVVFIPVARV